MIKADCIRRVLEHLIHKSYLPAEYFRVDSSVLDTAADAFESDFSRWFPLCDSYFTDKLFTTPQLIAILCYRISHTINQLPPQFRERVMHPYAADAFSILGREIGQIEIFYSSTIGSGFKINHGVGTVIGARCRIGNNCTIHQNCTLGDRNGGRPTIGDNVTIYAGSLILGNITIGSNSVIGANSVVTRSCPEGSVLVGSPAKIIKTI